MPHSRHLRPRIVPTLVTCDVKEIYFGTFPLHTGTCPTLTLDQQHITVQFGTNLWNAKIRN